MLPIPNPASAITWLTVCRVASPVREINPLTINTAARTTKQIHAISQVTGLRHEKNARSASQNRPITPGPPRPRRREPGCARETARARWRTGFAAPRPRCGCDLTDRMTHPPLSSARARRMSSPHAEPVREPRCGRHAGLRIHFQEHQPPASAPCHRIGNRRGLRRDSPVRDAQKGQYPSPVRQSLLIHAPVTHESSRLRHILLHSRKIELRETISVTPSARSPMTATVSSRPGITPRP